MRFGSTLRKSIYPPWKEHYVNYEKLKKLLKESDSASSIDSENDVWTAEDESAFVDELMNNQLQKVHKFQTDTSQKLRDRTAACERKLEPLALGTKEDGEREEGEASASASKGKDKAPMHPDEKKKLLKETLEDLDTITKEINELEKFSRINYTAFFKATKKHDRKRGQSYRLRPYLETRLAAHPLNSEDYSPLIFRLSAMYSFVRQSLEGKPQESLSFGGEEAVGAETFQSHKFWVHPDNILEVKTVILRRLPVLVYNPQASKIAEGSQRDPTITSIYFDNPSFSLYTDKVNHAPDAGSVRLRWYGQLAEKPEILVEKKVIKQGDHDNGPSEEERFPIKPKYIQPFIEGKYHMEKSIAKMERQERTKDNEAQIDLLKKSVNDIQSFIKENSLQPMVRANYTRTAFQIPGDDRIRISLDTNLAFIREDAVDPDRPCRDPDDWHRRDIDTAQMEYPFPSIRKGEINRFPYALLEIKTKGLKKYEWIDDLMSSHLVYETHRFSKFVHGVAMLFEDHVNTFPFWIGDVETDIRKEPQQAFEQEQERRKKAAEDEVAVGSLFGAKASSYQRSVQSPVGSPEFSRSLSKSHFSTTPRRPSRLTVGAERASYHDEEGRDQTGKAPKVEEEEEEQDEETAGSSNVFKPSNLASLFPSFPSTSKYARRRRERQQQALNRQNAPLPAHLTAPSNWIKDSGPVRVEAKVWLANQRTFIKWQHVSVLLASLSLGLYNAAGEDNNVARALAVVYTFFALFALAWGWGLYMWRMKLIERRSGRDFDNVWGPLVVCGGLVVALCMNFAFKYQAIKNGESHGQPPSANVTVAEMWNEELRRV